MVIIFQVTACAEMGFRFTSSLFKRFDVFCLTGSGFISKLPKTRDKAKTLVEYLKNHSWVDSRTRLVLLQMNFYNFPTNLFAVVTVSWEFLATGGALPYISIQVLFWNYFENWKKRQRRYIFQCSNVVSDAFHMFNHCSKLPAQYYFSCQSFIEKVSLVLDVGFKRSFQVSKWNLLLSDQIY